MFLSSLANYPKVSPVTDISVSTLRIADVADVLKLSMDLISDSRLIHQAVVHVYPDPVIYVSQIFWVI